jgi:hypothetical protein
LEPRAFEKAKSLCAFAQASGSKPTTFALCLSAEEALELLDWFVEQNPDNELLYADVHEAHRTNEPFTVLEHFNLMGLSIVPKSVFH